MRLRNQLLLGYAVVFAVMVIIAGVTYTSTSWLIASQDSVEETYQTIVLASRLEVLVVEMQNAKRGFLISGDEDLQQSFEEARKAYRQGMERLKSAVSSNSRQVLRLEEVDSQVNTWIDTVGLPQIEKRRKLSEQESTGAKATALIQEGVKGRTLFKDVHRKLETFIETQRNLREQQSRENDVMATRSIASVIFGSLLAIVLGTGIMLLTTRRVLRQVGGEPAAIAEIAEEIGKGNLDVQFEDGNKEHTGIRSAIGGMLESLQENRKQAENRDWLKTGVGRLNEVMSGDPDLGTLASKVISEIVPYLDGHVGALYLAQDGLGQTLSLKGSYAYKKRKNLSNVFALGEGLVGQAALEKQQILLKNVPEDYVKVTSGIGERVPTFICVTPFMYEGRVKGVVEIGTLNEMTDIQLEYLEQVMPALAVAVETAESRTKLVQALAESQQLSEELQAQQEELRTTNEELEEHTRRLKESEEKLRVQQEELQVTNEELEEKNELLQRQKHEVERGKKEIEAKAQELAVASKYKSEFLSNMSHELRTPLNSLLLLAQSLAENKEGTLTEEQVQSAGIIYKSGTDLLNLISEILDLAKIEAGRMDLRLGPLRALDLAEGIRAVFEPLAAQKGLELAVKVDPLAPEEIVTDRKRVEQVIKNLVANAIKFTQSGSVTVEYGRPGPEIDLSRSGLHLEKSVSISVKDTGIGIPREQQDVVFEAFQQADGSTARKYGGTGLGLSISRELARLLGGEIHIESALGSGSTFTLYLPAALKADQPTPARLPTGPATASSGEHDVVSRNHLEAVVVLQIEDDREALGEGDRIVLVVEDDPDFARILYDKCHEKGFKCLAAATGEAGLELAQKHLPNGIILDIRLPGIDGWTVLSTLKENTRTRHIPVHIISVEEASVESLRKGAVGHVTKPIKREDLEEAFKRLEEMSPATPKRVLVVEDDETMRGRVVELIGNGIVKVDEAATGEQAVAALRSTKYACVILDLGLPDMDGRELLKRLQKENMELPPIIIHTARDLTSEEEIAVREYADSVVLKDVRSTERLLDEVSLFLHWMVKRMPEQKRQIIRNLHETDELLRNKKVLVVDDDMRTLFALSRLLTDRGMRAVKAENGERALQLLDEEPDVDIVLMDIMMPVMDGYETMEKIRGQERFRRLPIIALTAKAMPKDREQCLAAGANDYMTKPVDQERLVSLLRVWLYR
jgi:CheY-like chemotaxis protein/signal transduction histidine kinase/CHASE3 domain sensor protein